MQTAGFELQLGTPVPVSRQPQLDKAADLNALAWSLRRAEPQRALSLAAQVYRQAGDDSADGAHSLLTAAFCAIDACRYDVAAEHLAEARERFAALADALGQAGVELLTGLVDLRANRYEEALAKLFRALASYQQLEEPAGEAQALTYAGEAYRYRGSFELSLDCLQRAFDLCAEGCTLLRSEALLAMSMTYRLLGNYKQALSCALQALELKRAVGDALGEAFTLNSLGLIYHDPDDSAQALDYYLQGLALSEKVGDPRSRSALLGNLGELYGGLGKFDEALSYLWQSVKLAEAASNKQALGISLDCLGVAYGKLGNAEAALRHHERALELRQAIGDRKGQATSLHRLGEMYLHLGRTDEALAYYLESLRLAREVNHRLTEAEALLALGTAHRRRNREASPFFREALAIARGLGHPRLVRDSCRALYELHKEKGEPGEALAWFEACHAADAELSDEASRRKTQRLMIGFELEKARQETQIQRLRNVELAAANEALEKVNAQNDRLLEKLREQTQRLQRQTEEDSLTGLYNRRYLEAYLVREFKRAQRYRQALCVAMVDVDCFKSINDRFSHALGDEVLKTVAEIFTRTLRTVDTAARYGGEEFVLVLPGIALDQGEAVCERVRGAVESYPWAGLHPDLHVTVSLGLAADLTLANFEKLLSSADEKLYAAKRGGRNRVVG